MRPGARAGGEWRVERQRLRWDVLDAFAQAAQQAGIPHTEDFNRGDNEGVGYFHVNQKPASAGTRPRPFCGPAQHTRQNLQVWTGAQIGRVLTEARDGARPRSASRCCRSKAARRCRRAWRPAAR